jgi:hypothetical protein
LIVAAAERPELVERIIDGTIHTIICPNGHAIAVDAPLLLFRPEESPPLIFSPAERTTAEQDRENARSLVGMLRDSLAGEWRDERLNNFAPVPREVLPALLSGDEAALQAAMAGAIPPEAAREMAEIAATLEAEGVTLESPEDLERALATRPELRARLEAALRG